jgi:hypothetical protein
VARPRVDHEPDPAAPGSTHVKPGEPTF